MQTLVRSKTLGVTGYGGRGTAGAGPGRDLLYTVAGGRERQTRLPENPQRPKTPWSRAYQEMCVRPAASVTGDFKTVEQQDPLLSSQTITIKATQIAALAHDPPRRFIEIDKNLIVINGDIFEHLAPEMMCPAWLYEEMARADTLICGSQTVVDNMFDVLQTETDRRLNNDFNALRMANMLRVPIFSWPVKPKPAGDPTTFNVRWLLISSPDSWSRKV